MKLLENKKILFFCPYFFGYEIKIKNKMEELGANVDMYDERSITKNWEKSFLKINPNIFNHKSEKYYKEIFNKVKNNKYDYILFIKCDMTTEKILRKYKVHFTNSKMCLYLWDSIKNIPNIKKKFKYFDLLLSFDRYDCLNYKELQFRPLFFCDEYTKKEIYNQHLKYDLCFIGTIHSDRYKLIKVIENYCKKNGLKMYLYPYLQSKFIYYFYKIVNKEFHNTKITDFKFKKLSSNEITDIVNKSKIIVDIHHPNQTGLTMRTIEMLGLNKKLITTNKDIINYDFYDENNIIIIDRNGNELALNKLKGDYKIDDVIYSSYSIKNWIVDVLGVEQNE